ncbi:MAG: hypothetical protein SGBAC_010423 [Bacillariaceae sp.]
MYCVNCCDCSRDDTDYFPFSLQLLASCLDSCETEELRDQLLAHVVTCLEQGMPELKGDFGIEIKRVWKGIGSIAALHVNVTSKYNHEAAPVPSNTTTTTTTTMSMKSGKSERNAAAHDPSHGHDHDHDHYYSRINNSDSRAEIGTSNNIRTSRFRTVERYWEKDIEVIDGLLKSGFSGGALISSDFNLKAQEITIEHDPQLLPTDKLQAFFADVGYEATVVSMGMSASLPAITIPDPTTPANDVTPDVTITQLSVVDDLDGDHDHSQSTIMTSVFKTVSPYQEKDMETIESVVKSKGGDAIISVDFHLPKQEITIDHVAQQHTTHDVGGFIAEAGFGTLVISMGMSATLPDADIAKTPEVSPTKPTLSHDFTPNDPITTQQSEDAEEDPGHSHSHDHTGSCGHDHSHDHNNNDDGSSNGKLRNLPEIKRMLEMASEAFLAPWVKINAIAAFTELAKAEAHTHGAASVDAVHFHEVGAVDSIVDTVGTLIALHALGVSSVSISKLPIGEGMVWTDHGLLPVPAPATLRLMIGVPTCPGPPFVTGELVTPTGAALLRALTMKEASKMKGRPPDNFTLDHVGIGAGTKNFDKHPNILRLMLGTVGKE